jgi:hypothetical protein
VHTLDRVIAVLRSWPCTATDPRSFALVCPVGAAVSPTAVGQPVDVEVLV